MAAPNNITIAQKWKALSGIEPKNWETLISDDGSIHNDDNDLLREYLVHYGQRVQAAVDSYNDMPKTQGYSLSLFTPDDLFPQTGLEIGNLFKYKVTDLIYARSGLDMLGLIHERKSAYMGYVAVATDEGAKFLGRRDILICWRGTILKLELMEDFDTSQVHARDLFDNSPAKVHQGFLQVYTRKTPDDHSPNDVNKDYTQNSAREQVIAAVKKHVDYYANTLKETVSITVTGHSLGAAIATLNSMDIVSNGYNKTTGSNNGAIQVTAFVSGCPHVGNKDFQKLFDSLSDDLHLLNIRNRGDKVPDHPKSTDLFEYDHVVGIVLDIDVTKTEDLKSEAIVWDQLHNSNIYLYAIASSQGIDKVPNKAIDFFDMAIVNKNADFLKDSFMVPKSWFQSVVKHGMVQMEDTGKWEQHHDYVPPVPSLVPTIPPN